jgi:hypothetical protein
MRIVVPLQESTGTHLSTGKAESVPPFTGSVARIKPSCLVVLVIMPVPGPQKLG